MKDRDTQLIFEAYTGLDSDQWDGGYESQRISGHGAEEDATRKGASPERLQQVVDEYKKEEWMWRSAKNDFMSMAAGESTDVRVEYYPDWKDSDFQVVIDALASK